MSLCYYLLSEFIFFIFLPSITQPRPLAVTSLNLAGCSQTPSKSLGQTGGRHSSPLFFHTGSVEIKDRRVLNKQAQTFGQKSPLEAASVHHTSPFLSTVGLIADVCERVRVCAFVCGGFPCCNELIALMSVCVCMCVHVVVMVTIMRSGWVDVFLMVFVHLSFFH